MGSGSSTLLSGRTRRQELGHEGRAREGQRVEEGEDSIWQQRNCSRWFSRPYEIAIHSHVRVTGREDHQKNARRKYWMFYGQVEKSERDCIV